MPADPLSLTIPGSLRLVGVLADPVAQVRTCQVLSEIYAGRGVAQLCVPFHVPASGLAAALAALRVTGNMAGVVLTIPHKQAGVGLCDQLSDRAALAQSVNAIRRLPDGTLLGETFDGRGLVAGLRAGGVEPRGQRVLLLGAGGAAASIATELAMEGIAALEIRNRTPLHAQALGDRLASRFPDLQIGPVAAPEIIVNATSLGLRREDQVPALPITGPQTVIADALILPEPGALAQQAAAQGATYIGGRAMLEGQIGLLADYFA